MHARPRWRCEAAAEVQILIKGGGGSGPNLMQIVPFANKSSQQSRQHKGGRGEGGHHPYASAGLVAADRNRLASTGGGGGSEA